MHYRENELMMEVSIISFAMDKKASGGYDEIRYFFRKGDDIEVYRVEIHNAKTNVWEDISDELGTDDIQHARALIRNILAN